MSASIDGGTVTVTFDQPLAADTLDTSNWTVGVDGVAYVITGADASGSIVTLNIGDESPAPAPDGVSYAADPPDLIGDNGLAVDAFSGFPLT